MTCLILVGEVGSRQVTCPILVEEVGSGQVTCPILVEEVGSGQVTCPILVEEVGSRQVTCLFGVPVVERGRSRASDGLFDPIGTVAKGIKGWRNAARRRRPAQGNRHRGRDRKRDVHVSFSETAFAERPRGECASQSATREEEI